MFSQMNELATSLSTNCHAQYYYVYRGFLRQFLREFPSSPLQASLLLVGIYASVTFCMHILILLL